jgi:hypothetical protein
MISQKLQNIYIITSINDVNTKSVPHDRMIMHMMTIAWNIVQWVCEIKVAHSIHVFLELMMKSFCRKEHHCCILFEEKVLWWWVTHKDDNNRQIWWNINRWKRQSLFLEEWMKTGWVGAQWRERVCEWPLNSANDI